MDKVPPGPPGQMRTKNPAGLPGLIALVFLAMLSLPLSLVYSGDSSRGEPQWIPVALHSILTADYSADPRARRIPAANLNLIKDVLADQASQDSSQAFEDVQDSLRTPVPTVESGYPRASATPTQPAAAEPSIPPATTPTRSRPTATRPQATQSASPTPTLTNIILLPSRTPSPTKEPTRTSKPPREAKPTDTPRPTQKPTQPPPTQPPPTKPPTHPPPTKPPPPDPYPPPPPPPKPTEPYP